MYKLEIIQGNNSIVVTDIDIDVLTDFVCKNIFLFGPETKFIISRIDEVKR